MLRIIFIWIVGGALALASGLVAMGAIAKVKAPALAVALQPVNGFAAESFAAASIKATIAANGGEFPTSVDQATLDWAKLAFLKEPVTPEAISIIALGKTGATERQLMEYGLSVSRREQLIIGWMIIDSGTKNDIPAVLNSYDILLRTSSSAATAIIPVMATALSDENFVEPFADLLATNPPWARRFWGQVTLVPQSIQNAAQLRGRLYNKNERSERYRDRELIAALIKDKQFNTAGKLYSLLSDQPSGPVLIKNYSFEHDSQYPPLDWRLFSNGEYGATITNGALQMSAIRNSGGLFARQLVELPPQNLQFEAKYANTIPIDANIQLRITCAEKVANLTRTIRFRLTGDGTQQIINNQRSGCSYYWIDIVGRASENGDGFDISLKSIALRVE
tara:strand:- start:3662 stop:4840 length:1179 start_codon:yes stop_codon:yes gene_type:complete